MIKVGKFREDLYYRLNVLEVNMPPLRERKDDIPLLVDFFIKRINRKQGKYIKEFTEDAIELLQSYDWPGNIRELKNLIEKLIITSESQVLGKKQVLEYIKGNNEFEKSEPYTNEIVPIAVMEKRLITSALRKYGDGVLGKQLVAQKLKISLSTLYNKIHRYNIQI
jgi:transcriptional regulator with PAS, ATPase and Fis domain